MGAAGIGEAWERYAVGRGPRRERNAAGALTWFNWTSYPDHGPDERVLGPVGGRAVLELGCGTGRNLAHLATLGADCTGLDVSPTQLAKARARWGALPVGLRFREAEAVAYLAGGGERACGGGCGGGVGRGLGLVDALSVAWGWYRTPGVPGKTVFAYLGPPPEPCLDLFPPPSSSPAPAPPDACPADGDGVQACA